MNDTNCPNCNGELYISDDKTQLICKYCDSIYNVDNVDNAEPQSTTGEENADNEFVEKYLDIRIQYLNEKTSETLSLLCNLINYNNTVDDYMEGVNIVAKSSNEFATQENSLNILMTAVKNTQGHLLSDEIPLVFINLGLLSKGKDGILITDKSILRITKKVVLKINMQDIYSLNATSEPYTFSSWHINGNFKFDVAVLSERVTAIILGLICTLARNCHPENYRVVIDNQDDKEGQYE